MRDVEPTAVLTTLWQVNRHWLVAAVAVRLTSIGLRRMRSASPNGRGTEPADHPCATPRDDRSSLGSDVWDLKW
jgi:hypothetical protein